MEKADGYTVHRTIEVHRTLACEDDTTPGLVPSVSKRAENMRRAEVAFATLIGIGVVERDYNDPDWSMQHEAAVRAIARAFDSLEVKV